MTEYMSLLCWLNAEAILRATAAARDEELTAKRLAASSRELGILGLPQEKMALVREKKDDIEKVVCNMV